MPALAARKHRKLVVDHCHPLCGLNPNTLGDQAPAVLAILEAGGPQIRMAEAINGMGVRTNQATISRHMRHISDAMVELEDDPTDKGPSDMDIIEMALKKAWKHRASWRPTLADTVKLVQLRQNMGGSSPFEAMLNAMAAATSEDEEEEDADAIVLIADADADDQPADAINADADINTPESEGYR